MQCLVRRGSDWAGALLGLPMPPAFGQDAELFESDPVFPSDSRILEIAREEAEAWLAKDPDLTSAASRRLRATLEDRWAGRLELARVG